MKSKPRKGNRISRRGVLPLLGSTLLIPFLGFSKSNPDKDINTENEEYQTLLKPDGTTVKVKASVLKKSNIIKKNISNKSFLKWLDRKL